MNKKTGGLLLAMLLLGVGLIVVSVLHLWFFFKNNSGPISVPVAYETAAVAIIPTSSLPPTVPAKVPGPLAPPAGGLGPNAAGPAKRPVVKREGWVIGLFVTDRCSFDHDGNPKFSHCAERKPEFAEDYYVRSPEGKRVSNVTRYYARTDVLILLYIHPDGLVEAVSIPRDLWVYVPGIGEEFKINTAYFYGVPEKNRLLNYLSGVEGLKKCLEHKGVYLDYYLVANFDAVAVAVDALGGLDVMIGGEVKHLTGKEVVAYSRDRSVTGSSDLDRMRHQQDIALAALRKIKGDPGLVKKVYEAVSGLDPSEHLTDIGWSDILELLVLIVQHRFEYRWYILDYASGAIYWQNAERVSSGGTYFALHLTEEGESVLARFAGKR